MEEEKLNSKIASYIEATHKLDANISLKNKCKKDIIKWLKDNSPQGLVHCMYMELKSEEDLDIFIHDLQKAGTLESLPSKDANYLIDIITLIQDKKLHIFDIHQGTISFVNPAKLNHQVVSSDFSVFTFREDLLKVLFLYAAFVFYKKDLN